MKSLRTFIFLTSLFLTTNVMAQDPFPLPEPKAPTAEEMYSEARKKMGAGDLRAAVAAHSKLIRAHPTHPVTHRAYGELAQLLMKAKQPGEALKVLDYALKAGKLPEEAVKAYTRFRQQILQMGKKPKPGNIQARTELLFSLARQLAPFAKMEPGGRLIQKLQGYVKHIYQAPSPELREHFEKIHRQMHELQRATAAAKEAGEMDKYQAGRRNLAQLEQQRRKLHATRPINEEVFGQAMALIDRNRKNFAQLLTARQKQIKESNQAVKKLLAQISPGATKSPETTGNSEVMKRLDRLERMVMGLQKTLERSLRPTTPAAPVEEKPKEKPEESPPLEPKKKSDF